MLNTINYKITTDSFVRFFLVTLGIVLAWTLRDILISILVAVMLASIISPLATAFRKIYIPRSVTVLLVLVAMIGILVSVFVFLVPLVYSEFSTFAKSFYTFQRDAINFISNYTGNKALVSNVVKDWQLEDIQNFATNLITTNSSAVGSTFSTVTFFGFQLLISFVITFYLAVQEKGVERFLRIITPPKSENYIINLWERSQAKIVAWAKGQIILALMMGLSIFIGLKIFGLENAFSFALLAAVGEVVPMVGLLVAGIATVLFALVSNGISTAMWVGIFFIVMVQIESHVLSPLIVNKVVGIPSVIVIIALVAGGAIAGFWGVLLAVPVAATIMEFVSDFEDSKRKELEEIAS